MNRSARTGTAPRTRRAAVAAVCALLGAVWVVAFLLGTGRLVTYGGLQPGVRVGVECGWNVGLEAHNGRLVAYRGACDARP